jgi:hypothetical protein
MDGFPAVSSKSAQPIQAPTVRLHLMHAPISMHDMIMIMIS